MKSVWEIAHSKQSVLSNPFKDLFQKIKVIQNIYYNFFQVKATKLFPFNKDVDSENFSELDLLDGPEISFEAIDSLYCQKFNYLQHFLVPSSLTLKEKAQVMLLRNVSTGLKILCSYN